MTGKYIWFLTQKWDKNNPHTTTCSPTAEGIWSSKKKAEAAAQKANLCSGRNYKVYSIKKVRIK